MNFRPFGNTGLEVSETVFGGGRVGGIVIFGDDDTKRVAVRSALDAGVNWFDTAMSYGNGQSEEALGWLLAEVPETPYVSTKVTIDVERLDDLPGQIEQSLHASLKRLQRSSVDLYQLHGQIEPDAGGRAIALDDVVRRGGVLDGLDRMRDQGLVRFIGLTGLGDAGCLIEAIATGRFDSAQVYYNMLNPSAARAMPAGWTGHAFSGVMDSCREQGMAVMAIRIFAAGYLATAIRHGRESILTKNTAADEEERKAEFLFRELGDEHGSRAQTAVRFALSNPDVSCAVVGLGEVSHMDEAAAAVELGALPGSAFDRLTALYDTDFGRV